MVLTPRQWTLAFNRRAKALKYALRESVDDSAAWGANYAAKIAPKDTTTLVQSISFKTIENKGNKSAMIYIRPIENPKGGRTTKYAAIMHRKGGKNVWHSGDRYFMFTTRKEVAKKFDTKVRFAVGRFLGKKPT